MPPNMTYRNSTLYYKYNYANFENLDLILFNLDDCNNN